MKCCISITNTDQHTKRGKLIFDICINSVKKYCDRFKFDLSLHTTPVFKMGVRYGYNYGTFEKFQVIEDLKKYDRVLRIDSDIIITPECPNLFDIVPEDRIGAVRENLGDKVRILLRQEQIRLMQCALGKIELPETLSYFNSGVMILSQQHVELFQLSHTDITNALTKNFGLYKEQNLLNYRVLRENLPIYFLPYTFNHMSMFSQSWNGSPNRKNSNIIHYAGPQESKLQPIIEDHNYFENENIKPIKEGL